MTGFTKRGNPVAARLPEPIFMLDSEGAVIEKAAYDRLEWSNEGRTKDDPPPYGSKVHALFIRLESSEMRERAAE